MAKGVVDLLEAVEVEHQQGEGALRTLRLQDILLKAVDEQGAVGQTGKGVMQHCVTQFLLRAFAFRDIGEHTKGPGVLPVLISDAHRGSQQPDCATIPAAHTQVKLQMLHSAGARAIHGTLAPDGVFFEEEFIEGVAQQVFRRIIKQLSHAPVHKGKAVAGVKHMYPFLGQFHDALIGGMLFGQAHLSLLALGHVGEDHRDLSVAWRKCDGVGVFAQCLPSSLEMPWVSRSARRVPACPARKKQCPEIPG